MTDIPNGILRYKTSKDAAELLGIQPQLVNRYCREGRLSAVKLFGRWYVKPADLKKFSQIKRLVGGPSLRDRFN